MVTRENKQFVLKVIWFAVMAVTMWFRIYDYITRFEGLAIFVIYTLIHVMIIEKLVLGRNKE